MALEEKNYDPALMAGANIGVAVDLTDITDNNGNEVIEIDGVTSAVNFLRTTNAATGSAAVLSAQGDDANVALWLSGTGTGDVILKTGDSTKSSFIAKNVATSVNQITATPAATGSNPSLSATGSDSIIGLQLTPTGTALVLLGNTSTGTIAAGAVTINAQRGVITTGAALTAGTAVTVLSFDFVNNKIWPTSILALSLGHGTGNTTGIPILGKFTLGSGSATVTIRNADTSPAGASVNGSLTVHFAVLN